MTIQSTTLRPGLLVSLKTSLAGNVRYTRQTVEEDHRVDGGALRGAWETTRVIMDPREHELAGKVRSRCRTIISAVCAQSAFGLLCPESDADRLVAAVKEARDLADEFNAQAQLSRLSVYVITGRVAPDDVEAVKAINSEVRELLASMEKGLANLDVKVVRDAADKAKQLGAMLTPDAAARIQIAIDAARSAARRIVKAGETAAQEIDQATLRKIAEQRTAFLDLDDAREVEAPTETGRGVDLAPVADVAAPQASAPAVELT